STMMREWFGRLHRNSTAVSPRPRSSFKPAVQELEERAVPTGFAFVGNASQLASAITAADQGGSNPNIILLTNNIALTQALPTITGSMTIIGNGHTLGSASPTSGQLGFSVLDIVGPSTGGALPTVALESMTIQGGSAVNGGGVYAADA